MTKDPRLDGAATGESPADADAAWQDGIRRGVRQARDLEFLPLSPDERAAAAEAAARHKVRIPRPYLDLIDWDDPADPIRLQVIPSSAELAEQEGELADPIADHGFSPAPRLTHRHADRVLLFPTYQCAVYCRFCFRKESLASIGRGYTREALEEAYAYIEAHPEIREVILTGGDPLSLPDKALAEIRARLERIAHVRLLRIHTRVPVVLPARVTEGLVEALQGRLMVTVVTHFNHAREITEATERACRALRHGGFVLLNQSVLLKGVNDSVEVLEELCRELMYRLGVKPYYLHHGDLARGMAHRRTTIEEGQALAGALRARLSGICNPLYVIDLPEGGGKVPLGPCYVEAQHGRDWQFRGHDGRIRTYQEIVGGLPEGPGRQRRGGRPEPMEKKHRIYTISFASVYPHYVAKAEKKGRTRAEVDEIICWLTGYSRKQLETQLDKRTDFETFYGKAPRPNPSRALIKGVVCGVRVEEIEDPVMREARYLDKLIDELARGRPMDKILRKA